MWGVGVRRGLELLSVIVVREGLKRNMKIFVTPLLMPFSHQNTNESSQENCDKETSNPTPPHYDVTFLAAHKSVISS